VTGFSVTKDLKVQSPRKKEKADALSSDRALLSLEKRYCLPTDKEDKL
jgi:hypothetical protein